MNIPDDKIDVPLKDILKEIRADRTPVWEPEWRITEDGDLEHINRYYIEKERLAENWLDHMREKKWNDMNKFVPAYLEACRRAGVKMVKVTYY
jgi:hypothetical protein